MSSDQQTRSRVGSWVDSRVNSATELLLVGGRQVWDGLVYSSAYIALIAALEVVMVMYVLDLPPNPAPLVVGCVTFAIYVNDRLVDTEVDAASSPRRTAFVRRYSRTLTALAAIAYGLAVALAVYGGPRALGLTLFPAVVWVLYAVDWAPTEWIPFQRMKELLFVNSLLVAIAWAATVVLLPVVFADVTLTPTVGILLVYFAIGTFMGTEIANVGDVETDRDGNVATLPTVVGVQHTRRALYAIGLGGLGLLGYAFTRGYLGGVAVTALAVGLCCMLGVVALLGRIDDTELLAIGGECARLPVLVFLVVPTAGL